MALPEFSLRQLLEAGVHFGHKTERWNPKMAEFIYGKRNGIHIIDLAQTFPMFQQALQTIYEVVAKGGRVLFVGTKRQAQSHIAEAAQRSAQHYMNHRWLGGTLTNWNTISNSIKRLNVIEQEMEEGMDGLTKKERLGLEREKAKLQASLGGIREMGTLPDLIFVIDVNKENLAVLEAKKLGIPVIAVVDTNCTPEGVDYIIPGNDDAGRAIAFYCDLVSRTIIEGMSRQMSVAEIDIGADENAGVEATETAEAVAEAAPPAEEPAKATEEAAAPTPVEEAPAAVAEAAPPAEEPAKATEEAAAPTPVEEAPAATAEAAPPAEEPTATKEEIASSESDKK